MRVGFLWLRSIRWEFLAGTNRREVCFLSEGFRSCLRSWGHRLILYFRMDYLFCDKFESVFLSSQSVKVRLAALMIVESGLNIRLLMVLGEGDDCVENDSTPKNDEKSIVVRIRGKQAQALDPLFSQNDVRKIVFEFVLSWIRGDIVIRFPTAAELAKKTPLSLAFPVDPSVNAELKIKEHYVDLLSVCAGIMKASFEEQEKAIQEVFKMLLMFRSANRIEGKIISNDFEERLADVEKSLDSISKTVQQVTGYLFKEKKSLGSGKSKAKSRRLGKESI